jgi:hypothetical protein
MIRCLNRRNSQLTSIEDGARTSAGCAIICFVFLLHARSALVAVIILPLSVLLSASG